MTTDPTGRSFLSYRRARLPEAQLLVRAQQALGIPTWHDVDDLGSVQTEDTIRSLINDPSIANALLWISPEVADSDFIRKIEVPGFVRRARTDPGFFLVSRAAGGINYASAAAFFDGQLGVDDLRMWNIPSVRGNPIDNVEAEEIAKVLLGNRLTAVHRCAAQGEPLRLLLYTRMAAPRATGAALEFDWSRYFDGRLPVDGFWSESARHLSVAASAVHAAAPGRRVLAEGFCSLSSALLLGAAFSATRGIGIGWKQRMADGGEQTWSLDAKPTTTAFEARVHAGDINSTDIAVLVSVSADTESPIRRSAAAPHSFRASVRITHTSAYPRLLNSPGEAKDVAQKVVSAMRLARDSYPDAKMFHLFIAGPVGLAMMIGQLANTLGPVQTYEHIPGDAVGTYVPAALISTG